MPIYLTRAGSIGIGLGNLLGVFGVFDFRVKYFLLSLNTLVCSVSIVTALASSSRLAHFMPVLRSSCFKLGRRYHLDGSCLPLSNQPYSSLVVTESPTLQRWVFQPWKPLVS